MFLRYMKNIFPIRPYAVIFLSILSTSCATIFSGSDETVTFDSVPQGASVYVGLNYLGKTPVETRLKKRLEATKIAFELEGYEKKEVELARNINGTAYLNLFFISTTSGVTSWGIDALSGKLFNYSSNQYAVILQKKGEATTTYYNREDRIRFILQNSTMLENDVARGQGEYLEHYCSFYAKNMNTPEFNSATCLGDLKSVLSEKSVNPI